MQIGHEVETTLPPVTDVRGPNGLIVKESPGRGRGVFAGQDFEEGDLIETCPVIVVPADEGIHLRLTTLGRYSFQWRRGSGVVLGYGALINHSSSPNAAWDRDVDNNVMHFFAVRPIAKGEEITHDYGRRKYRPDSVDPPPWWAGYRPTKKLVMMVGGAVVGLGIAGLLGRRARRSLTVTR